jgi:hypothetical protein
VLVVRQGRDIVAIKRYSGEDTMTIVGRVIDAIEEYKPILSLSTKVASDTAYLTG